VQSEALEYCKTFNEEEFKQRVASWREKTELLQQLEADPEYKKKYRESKELSVAFASAEKTFERAKREHEKAVEYYEECMERWDNIRYIVSKWCLEEFDERVELILLPPQHASSSSSNGEGNDWDRYNEKEK